MNHEFPKEALALLYRVEPDVFFLRVRVDGSDSKPVINLPVKRFFATGVESDAGVAAGGETTTWTGEEVAETISTSSTIVFMDGSSSDMTGSSTTDFWRRSGGWVLVVATSIMSCCCCCCLNFLYSSTNRLTWATERTWAAARSFEGAIRMRADSRSLSFVLTLFPTSFPSSSSSSSSLVSSPTQESSIVSKSRKKSAGLRFSGHGWPSKVKCLTASSGWPSKTRRPPGARRMTLDMSERI